MFRWETIMSLHVSRPEPSVLLRQPSGYTVGSRMSRPSWILRRPSTQIFGVLGGSVPMRDVYSDVRIDATLAQGHARGHPY